MKNKIIVFLIVFATVVSYKVYDRQGRLVEIWRDKGSVIEVYGPQMERKGYIEKEANRWSRYDKESNKVATIERADNGTVTIDEAVR